MLDFISAEQLTLKHLADRVSEAAISYAVAGSMAVELHGARRLTNAVNVLLTSPGLDSFRSDLVPRKYEPVPGRSRRFVDRDNGVIVEVFLTGHYPGRTSPGPFPFPDPVQASQEIDNVRVLTLPHLIQCKLAAGQYSDLGEVVSLIQGHNMDESYMAQLNPAVHHAFIKCLEEKRRDDEFHARED